MLEYSKHHRGEQVPTSDYLFSETGPKLGELPDVINAVTAARMLHVVSWGR